MSDIKNGETAVVIPAKSSSYGRNEAEYEELQTKYRGERKRVLDIVLPFEIKNERTTTIEKASKEGLIQLYQTCGIQVSDGDFPKTIFIDDKNKQEVIGQLYPNVSKEKITLTGGLNLADVGMVLIVLENDSYQDLNATFHELFHGVGKNTSGLVKNKNTGELEDFYRTGLKVATSSGKDTGQSIEEALAYFETEKFIAYSTSEVAKGARYGLTQDWNDQIPREMRRYMSREQQEWTGDKVFAWLKARMANRPTIAVYMLELLLKKCGPELELELLRDRIKPNRLKVKKVIDEKYHQTGLTKDIFSVAWQEDSLESIVQRLRKYK